MRTFSLYDDDAMDKAYAFLDDGNSAVMVLCGVDPVEMLPDEAREFARALLQLADEHERIDNEADERHGNAR